MWLWFRDRSICYRCRFAAQGPATTFVVLHSLEAGIVHMICRYKVVCGQGSTRSHSFCIVHGCGIMCVFLFLYHSFDFVVWRMGAEHALSPADCVCGIGGDPRHPTDCACGWLRRLTFWRACVTAVQPRSISCLPRERTGMVFWLFVCFGGLSVYHNSSHKRRPSFVLFLFIFCLPASGCASSPTPKL